MVPPRLLPLLSPRLVEQGATGRVQRRVTRERWASYQRSTPCSHLSYRHTTYCGRQRRRSLGGSFMRSWLLVGAVVGSVAAVASGCSGNNGPGSYTDFCTQQATVE